ncbi:MAG TPA: hypothetical protein VGK20_04290 [Candidatus Binatia bacterium]|jgi:hypothetical protein
MSRQPTWKTAIDILLVPIAVFRVVVGYTVDLAVALGYPPTLRGCAAACSSGLCAFNCELRQLLRLDLADYLASGIDPVSSELGLHIRFMMGFYAVCVAPFMVMLVYALWRKKEAIRGPAIMVGSSMALLMGLFIVRAVFGHPPSTNPGLLLLDNIVDVVAPFLILIRVIPRPLFA